MTTVSIAHLGPPGTNAEVAALNCAQWIQAEKGQSALLCPYPTIAQTLHAVAAGDVQLAVVPVENSIEGSVTVTLDTLWQLDHLRIQAALVLSISHALISRVTDLATIRTVYSHPQALAQCQVWLRNQLPQAQLIASNSTAEALNYLNDPTAAAIASNRAAKLYDEPILVADISDYPDNCTRFWVLSQEPSPGGAHTSLAFSLPDAPGALVKPLQIFAQQNINLSRIESRPSKRSLGDYLFFVDLEADIRDPIVQTTLEELTRHTETLKIFGSYPVLEIKTDGTRPHPAES